MMKRIRKPCPESRRPKGLGSGQRTYDKAGTRIVTHQVGALPLIDRIIKRMRLQEILNRHLPDEDSRTKVSTARVVLLLLKNLLVSREPMYGVSEWASNFGPELFDLWQSDFEHLNDDRIGRALQKVFEALDSNLIIDVVAHVVSEFNVRLDQLHNDSTTVTFTGDYAGAQRPQTINGHQAPAILWGHNKDHRPDLKQLLYILTVSEDGGVPIYFQAASGNVVDDQTHQATWRLLAELVGRPDFVYVADCKLATTDNMNEIAQHNGRFITVLPSTRKEDTRFREQLREQPSSITWDELYRVTEEDGTVRDILKVCRQEQFSKEGYRVLWFHSQSKAERDASSRAARLQRACGELEELRSRLHSPRTRFRSLAKVREAVQSIVEQRQVANLLKVEIEPKEEEQFRRATRGRPTETTKYTRSVRLRFDISWELNTWEHEEYSRSDGVFPLITNVTEWSAEAVLRAYKRQPLIENRFSQFKSDFRVAPVYLKSISRIVGLLAVYFFALMVQALLERELRVAMQNKGVESIPLYAEGRACAHPTTRQVLDVFEPIARHTLYQGPGEDAFEIFSTELAPIHKRILKLLNIPLSTYNA